MDKKKMVAKVRELVRDAKGIYFANFFGMPMAELQEVRRKLKAAGIRFSVVKNRLAAIALKEVGLLPKAEGFLVGPTSLIISGADITSPARLLKDFQKNYKIKFKGAIVEDAVFSPEEFDFLAGIPSREELLSSLVNSLSSPLTELTYQLTGLLASLVFTLEEMGKRGS